MAASSPSPTSLREVELRLLRCTFPTAASRPPPHSPPPVHPLGPVAASALAAVELGDYAAALASAVPHILRASASTEADDDSPAQFYGHLAAAAEVFVLGDDGGGAADEGFECRCALVLSAAVAALLAFTQQNVTGPPRKYSPFPFFSTSSFDDGLYSDAGGKQDQWASIDSHVHGKFVPFWTSSLDERWYSDPGGKWEAWASHHLASFGSHVHGKFLLLQFIVFAELLLTSIKSLDSDLCSVSWWLCRLSMSQQNILDELSSSLFDQVQSINKYGRVDASRLHLDSAQEVCGIHLSLTGILGFRTIHQVDAKSQMVLITKTTKPAADEGQSTEQTGAPDDVVALSKTRSYVPGESVCDILRTPLLAENVNYSNSGSTHISLTPVQQAAVLAQCLHFFRHMIRGKSQASVQSFREAVKFKRNSWQVWENYSKVALDTGNIRLLITHISTIPFMGSDPDFILVNYLLFLLKTLEAIKMVLNLSVNKCFNVDLLDKVMTTLEEQATHLNDTQEAKSIGNTSDDSNKETRQSSQLLDIIGDILEQVHKLLLGFHLYSRIDLQFI
ncbi:hypothetical protein TRIUR3_32003 [Triticum urartu]|uniref:Uncharacterized protein n=1 Tax=Triticum urartu TaxID=4572 RepID=M8B1N2_TRIUA|nr:hypothetical protein TRIUR3_32003 [Triticum urartu]